MGAGDAVQLPRLPEILGIAEASPAQDHNEHVEAPGPGPDLLQLQRLEQVKEQVDVASKGAVAAEAALLAVQQVLAAKQEAADLAHDSAALAGQKLQEYIFEMAAIHKVATVLPGTSTTPTGLPHQQMPIMDPIACTSLCKHPQQTAATDAAPTANMCKSAGNDESDMGID